jgi:hypothetical protein
VRLARYILLELAVGATLLATGGAAVYLGGQDLFETRPAQAAVEPAATRPRIVVAPAVQPVPSDPLPPPASPPPAVQPPPAPRSGGSFIGFADEELIGPLRDHALARVKFNKGGSSVSMRVDFAGGGRASFKPDQTNMQSVPRKEVAAYRMNRMVGLSSVAPAIPGLFPREDIVTAFTPDAQIWMTRFNTEVLSTEDNMVSGSLAWWIPEIVDAKVLDFHVDSVDGIVLWKRFLSIGERIPAEAAAVAPQISNMVAFDFLIDNFDRWSGSNVKSSPDGKMLYFMDNALSFGLDDIGQLKVRIYLKRSQKFSRKLYESVKRLDRDEIVDAMMTDTGPWPRLLSEPEIDSMMKRRDYLVGYIDDLIKQYGEKQVLVFP